MNSKHTCPGCMSFSIVEYDVQDGSYGCCARYGIDFDEEPIEVLELMNETLIYPRCPRMSNIPEVRIAYKMWYDRVYLRNNPCLPDSLEWAQKEHVGYKVGWNKERGYLSVDADPNTFVICEKCGGQGRLMKKEIVLCDSCNGKQIVKRTV